MPVVRASLAPSPVRLVAIRLVAARRAGPLREDLPQLVMVSALAWA